MRRAIFIGILLLLAAAGGMAIGRARSNAGFFSQPGSFDYLLRLLLVLAVYMCLTIWLGARPRPRLLPFPRIVLIAGVVGGMLEIAGILVENLLPTLRVLPIAVELAMFLSWAGVGALASRWGDSIRAGIVTSVAAAALCMVIGVCGGEIVEFFVHPAPASEVATWGEYLRSDWSDAAAFQIANTMDSATTHLVVAPFVALVLGSSGAALGSVRKKSNC